MSLAAARRGSASEMASSFLKFTLARWLKTWEDELNLKLLTPDERGRFYFSSAIPTTSCGPT